MNLSDLLVKLAYLKSSRFLETEANKKLEPFFGNTFRLPLSFISASKTFSSQFDEEYNEGYAVTAKIQGEKVEVSVCFFSSDNKRVESLTYANEFELDVVLLGYETFYQQAIFGKVKSEPEPEPDLDYAAPTPVPILATQPTGSVPETVEDEGSSVGYLYKYRALNEQSEEVWGNVRADTQIEAVAVLRSQGLYPVNIYPDDERIEDEYGSNIPPSIKPNQSSHKKKRSLTLPPVLPASKKVLPSQLHNQKEDAFAQAGQPAVLTGGGKEGCIDAILTFGGVSCLGISAFEFLKEEKGTEQFLIGLICFLIGISCFVFLFTKIKKRKKDS